VCVCVRVRAQALCVRERESEMSNKDLGLMNYAFKTKLSKPEPICSFGHCLCKEESIILDCTDGEDGGKVL
jgi:hypothetical protein